MRLKRGGDWVWVAIVVVALVAMAIHVWHYRFLCDDAYIMFRYARNMARGRGLVFNPGEYVEGYTSLLWVLHLALLERLGWSGEATAGALGFAYTVASLIAWGWLVSLGKSRSRALAVLAVGILFLASSRTWAVWSNSGMETRCFTFYVLISFCFLARSEGVETRRGRLRSLLLAGVALALSTFARPDGQVVFLAMAAFVAVRHRRLTEIAALAGPFALLVGAHYLWRHATYGYWLPNTYYAKVSAPWPEMGLRYLASFALEYALYLIVPLVAVAWRWIPQSSARRMLLVFLVAFALHAGYYGYFVGGDHFEFRVFDFCMPFLAWALAEAVVAIADRSRPLALAAAVAVGMYSTAIPFASARESLPDPQRPSVYHSTLGDDSLLRWIPGLPMLFEAHRALLLELTDSLVGVRQEEHKRFWQFRVQQYELARGVVEAGELPEATMISGAIGVLGYYIDLPLVDVLGLTDATVAHSPRQPGKRAMAHEIWASSRYLRSRKASLEIDSATAAPLPQVDNLPPGLDGRSRQSFSIRVRPNVWLNVVTSDPSWIAANFVVTPNETLPRKPAPGGV